MGLRCLLLLTISIAHLHAQLPSEFDQCPASAVTQITNLVSQNSLTGGQFALAQSGTLRCAGAVGYADSQTRRPMRPTTLMRVGSVSKTFTGMGILKLLDDGRISLDDPILRYFPDLLPSGGPTDLRWQKVTIRHLMQHSMGWDRALGGEPIQNSNVISAALGIRGPATSTDVARWVFRQNLHFEPGTKASYSGIAYALASLIITRVSGVPYEFFIRQNILEPLGLRVSVRVSRTLIEGQAFPGDADRQEARYDPAPSLIAGAPSIFPYLTGNLPFPYGTFYTESMEGSGGWSATAPALVAFVDGIMGRGRPAPLFKRSTLDEMIARPAYESASATIWYGIGWQILSSAAGVQLRFAGSITGSKAEVQFLSNTTTLAFLTNSDGTNNDISNTIYTALLQGPAGLPFITGSNLYLNPKYIEPSVALPEILSQKGVVHGASYERGVVPGAWFSIFGRNLATTTRTWASADFSGSALPTRLDGVEVRINGRPAAVYYVSPTQINAQVPASLSPGTATLTVVRDGIPGHPEPIEIRANAPEAFRYNVAGKDYAAALLPDGTILGDPVAVPGTRAARVGDTIQVFGTGFAPAPAGVIVDGVTAVSGLTATIGGKPATVAFAGLVGAGLHQLNLIVPDLPSGTHDLRITVNQATSLIPAPITVR